MTIDPNLGRFTRNPTIAQIGTYPITVIVTNSGGLAATQSYNLIVAADTQAPNVIIRHGSREPGRHGPVVHLRSNRGRSMKRVGCRKGRRVHHLSTERLG